MNMYHRIKDLPEHERIPFTKYLIGQICPWMPDEEMQDAYYQHDYQTWKELKGKVDPNWD